MARMVVINPIAPRIGFALVMVRSAPATASAAQM